MKDELLAAIREGRGYDFIASEGYRFSKEELITVLKEFVYALWQADETGMAHEFLARNLEEYL